MNADQEREANYFAMHLLVPDSLLAQEDLASLDWVDGKGMKDLAKKYGVSVSLMVLRVIEFRKKT